VKVSRTAWDSNLVAANTKFLAVLYEAGGGGAFAVIPHSTKGKIDPKLPVVTGHKSAVLDLDWNPFNENLIASVSEDCTGKIWGIPEGGLKDNLNEPLQTLSGHKRKVGTVSFSPVANNIVATSSTDFSVKVWDVEKGVAPLSMTASMRILSRPLNGTRTVHCWQRLPRTRKSAFWILVRTRLPRRESPTKVSRAVVLFGWAISDCFLLDSPKPLKEKLASGMLAICPSLLCVRILIQRLES